MENRLTKEIEQAYDSLIELTSSLISSIEKKIEEGVNKRSLYFLDILLQYSLIQIVIVDLRFSKSEAEYVKYFSRNGDIIEYMNECGYTDYTWVNISDPFVNPLAKTLDELKVNHLADDSGNLVASIAMALQLLNDEAQDVFNEYRHYILTIMKGMLIYDEDTNAELYKEIFDTPIYFALDYIAKTVSLNN